MATYYVAEGGTAANKAAATSGTYPGGCMSPAVHNGETFSAGDEILLSDEGGDIRGNLTPPSSGSDGNPIAYGAKSGDTPIVNGCDLVTGWTEYSGGTSTVASQTDKTDSTSFNIGYNNTSNYIQVSEWESASETFSLYSVKLWLGQKDTISSGDVWIEVWDDGSGSPGSLITNGTSAKVDATTITDTLSGGEEVEFTFSTPPSLTSGNKYYFVSKFDYTVGANRLRWWGKNSDTTGWERWYIELDNDEFNSADSALYTVVVKSGSVSNVWQATLTTEPNEVFIDENRGDKQTSIVNCVNEYDWYWDSNVLYIYSTSDPDSNYTSPGIEAQLRATCSKPMSKSYLSFDGIGFNKGRYQGLTVRYGTEVTIENCTATLNGDTNTSQSGVGIQTMGMNDVIIRNCHVHDNLWNGIAVDSTTGGGSPTSGILVEENLAEDNGHNGIQINVTDDGNTISDATFQYNRSTGSGNSGFFFQVEGTSAGLSGVDVLYNVSAENGTQGITTARVSSLYPTGFSVYGNTFTKNGNAGGVLECTDSDIQNNIFAENNTSDTYSYELQVTDGGGTANTADYNLLYNSDPVSSDIAMWNGTLRTWAEWQGDGHNLNGLNEAPDFTNAATDDYTLASDSPCIGTGVNLGSPYNTALMPSSTWPDGVVTGDQDDY